MLPLVVLVDGENLEEETVRSYFQTAEMVLVMKTHPVIRFLETRGIMNDKLGNLPLVVIVERIREDNIFCNQTIELVRRIYYPTLTAEEVKSKAMKYGFSFQDHLKANFPKDDVNAEYQEWLNGGAQRYKDNIIITPIAHVLDSDL